MVLKQFHKYIPQIGAQHFEDFILPNGGILVSINLTWIPFTYFNVNEESETIALGDIRALITDATTSKSIIGQLSISPPDAVIVESGSEWQWDHPDIDFLRSSHIIHKLRHEPAYALQPDGVLKGNLRVIASYDPVVQVIHGLSIKAEVISFDTNLT